MCMNFTMKVRGFVSKTIYGAIIDLSSSFLMDPFPVESLDGLGREVSSALQFAKFSSCFNGIEELLTRKEV